MEEQMKERMDHMNREDEDVINKGEDISIKKKNAGRNRENKQNGDNLGEYVDFEEVDE